VGLFLFAPLLLQEAGPLAPGSVEVEVLDAGQGTAVVLRTSDQTLLYDTGPGDGRERSVVGGVIGPALARHGSGPHRVIVSHGDMDHAGGLGAVRRRYPAAAIHASLEAPPQDVEPCRRGVRWYSSEATIETLHPTVGLPYLGNDSSCVLSVRSAGAGILLPGDISSAIESRLLLESVGRHDFLLVPHHGSNTSSRADFLARIRPRIAVATAGLGNRFGFPKDTVRERYETAGAKFWSTGDCGALRLRFEADGRIGIAGARRERRRIWRWPAAEGCP
jgi:competence protein ComEC